jgi:hypothetical protein
MACCGHSAPKAPVVSNRRAPRVVRIRVETAVEEAKVLQAYRGWQVNRIPMGPTATVLEPMK